MSRWMYKDIGLEIQELCTTLHTMRMANTNWNEGKVGGSKAYGCGGNGFLSVDPLTKKYPELTPYQFVSNRPIDGIDLDGKEWFNSKTILTVGGSASGGSAYGVSTGLKLGKAHDIIGVTYFASTSNVLPQTQDLSEGSINPAIIVGLEAGGDASINILFRPAFFQSQDAQLLSMPLGVDIGAKAGLAVCLSICDQGFGGIVGYGFGGTITTGNSDKIFDSLSFTYGEIDRLGGIQLLSVSITDEVKDTKGNIVGKNGYIATSNGKLGVSSGIVLNKEKNKYESGQN